MPVTRVVRRPAGHGVCPPLSSAAPAVPLADALAAVVAIAAARARQAGTLEALRAALLAAMDPGGSAPRPDPREAACATLPPIADATPQEAARLAALARRQT